MVREGMYRFQSNSVHLVTNDVEFDFFIQNNLLLFLNIAQKNLPRIFRAFC